jgi:hypothetical protein
MLFFFFHKIGKQATCRDKNRLVPVGEGRRGRERVWEGEYGANTMYTCM